MDLSSWQVNPGRDGVEIRLFCTDDYDPDEQYEIGWINVPDWMATAFANAILGDVEFARRTRRDANRAMVQGWSTRQVFCEPCYLEVDGNTPAVTAPYDGYEACVVCGFTRRDNVGEADARTVGVDQGTDSE